MQKITFIVGLGGEKIELIKQLLGPGFLVEYKLYYSKDFFSRSEYISDKKIHISWA